MVKEKETKPEEQKSPAAREPKKPKEKAPEKAPDTAPGKTDVEKGSGEGSEGGNGKSAEAKRAEEDLIQIEFVGLASEEAGHRVTLKETPESQGELDMFVGGSEFASIAKELGLMTPPRPLTHDVYAHLLEGLEIGFVRLEIYGLQENAYLSRLIFTKQGQETEMEIRPSDGIAIALRNKAPIFLNRRLLKNTLSPKDQDTLAQLVKKVDF